MDIKFQLSIEYSKKIQQKSIQPNYMQDKKMCNLKKAAWSKLNSINIIAEYKSIV